MEEGKKKRKKSEERKEEWKKGVKRENIERRRENGVKPSVRESRVWKVSLNIPSYTVEWRGTERRGALEPWRRCQ